MFEGISSSVVDLVYKITDILKLNSVYGIIKLVIDLSLVAIIAYFLFRLVKKTRAEQIIKGLIVIFILVAISYVFDLVILKFILTNIMTYGVLLVIVIFQPELRAAFEKIGRNSRISNVFGVEDTMAIKHSVSEICKAVEILSLKKIGALIVIERTTKVSEIAKEGITINGKLSSELLQSIFMPRSILHDGSVIVDRNTIIAAKCVLPLASENAVDKELGTRHRAAVGITEISDSIGVVVSEETGNVSVSENGKLRLNISNDKLREYLVKKMETSSLTKTIKEARKNKKIK